MTASDGQPTAGRPDEIAVLGLGKSGVAAARLLSRAAQSVYASDAAGTAATRAAAESLGAQGIAADAGRHDLDRIRRAMLVVASPGIPPTAPPLAAAREAGVPIVSEIEVGLKFLPRLRYIAVTGTNGKTTTTALIGHLLRALGHDAPDAGNIGLPVTEVALRERHPDWLALELSSFQLHDTPSIAPTVGVLTNLSPDHLDRYASVEEYYDDKMRLFANARPESRWVVNGDDPEVMRRVAAVTGEHFVFATQRDDATAYYDKSRDTLVVDGAPLLQRSEFQLLGDHNVANALAAAVAVTAADPAHRQPEARLRIADGLRTFRALPHRMEIVGEIDGVLWINDSKATNVSSTLVALRGMRRPYILLLGGRHKGEAYTALAEPLRVLGKKTLVFGEAADTIEQDLQGLVPLERIDSSFERVMDRARELAQPGDAVLLSPACSSYDMVTNYEHRGAEFRRLAVKGSG